MHTGSSEQLDYDVIIIGAGISGISFACRLQERNRHLSYCILEGRHELGGTWSFFKYPGLRSDSDLYTFGFPWKPWTESAPIAHGEAIIEYMTKAVVEEGVDRNIKYGHQVDRVVWSSKQVYWTVESIIDGETRKVFRSRFILLATGYYDYQKPLEADISGIDNFRGKVVHPQFWPMDLDLQGKDVVIIESGATAITLLPSLAKQTSHTTILQRSPSYVLSMLSEDQYEKAMRTYLPTGLANRLVRLKWIIWPTLFRQFCLWCPNWARRYLQRIALGELNDVDAFDQHHNPKYNPFEQRMCMCPDGDFYQCLRDGSASIVTDTVQRISEKSIELSSGQELRPDVIVTATGLALKLGGNIKLNVDGKDVNIPDRYVWRGLMLEGVPNLASSFGYFDAAWTLGVDVSAKLASRLLNEMEAERVSTIVPQLDDRDKAGMEDIRFMPLKSTYVEKGLSAMPKLADRPQWRARSTYLWELLTLPFVDIRTDLAWIRDM